MRVSVMLMGVVFFFIAVQGFRRVPDFWGRRTPKPIAAVCLLLAVGLVVLAFLLPVILSQTR
jgi:hypothetical protein